ncbi:hypothetical protein BaRGS_00010203 [Batillaria attramentaria]|uniref:Uncharacterized protein n=1 Tax=Batillaria attramentaria TaxID=370345 RepID=A0ABD0LHH3_9CAEN
MPPSSKSSTPLGRCSLDSERRHLNRVSVSESAISLVKGIGRKEFRGSGDSTLVGDGETVDPEPTDRYADLRYVKNAEPGQHEKPTWKTRPVLVKRRVPPESVLVVPRPKTPLPPLNFPLILRPKETLPVYQPRQVSLRRCIEVLPRIPSLVRQRASKDNRTVSGSISRQMSMRQGLDAESSSFSSSSSRQMAQDQNRVSTREGTQRKLRRDARERPPQYSQRVRERSLHSGELGDVFGPDRQIIVKQSKNVVHEFRKRGSKARKSPQVVDGEIQVNQLRMPQNLKDMMRFQRPFERRLSRKDSPQLQPMKFDAEHLTETWTLYLRTCLEVTSLPAGQDRAQQVG